MRRTHGQASGFALECAVVGLLVVSVVRAASLHAAGLVAGVTVLLVAGHRRGRNALGFSISRELLAEYGGTLVIESPAQGRRGCVVVLTLIAAAAAAARAPSRSEDPPSSARSS
jgi:hypothetical protein